MFNPCATSVNNLKTKLMKMLSSHSIWNFWCVLKNALMWMQGGEEKEGTLSNDEYA